MDQLIETIRVAVATDATAETRAAGAAACRTSPTALDPQAGQPAARFLRFPAGNARRPRSACMAAVHDSARGCRLRGLIALDDSPARTPMRPARTHTHLLDREHRGMDARHVRRAPRRRRSGRLA